MKIYYLLLLIGLSISSCVELPVINQFPRLDAWLWPELSEINQNEAVLYFKFYNIEEINESEITFFYKEITDGDEWKSVQGEWFSSEMYRIKLSDLNPNMTYLYFLSTSLEVYSDVEYFETKE